MRGELMVEHNYIDFGDKGAAAGSGGGLHNIAGDVLASLREFCTTWTRAVRTICLYPPTNPLPDEFREKFHDALTRHLDEQGSFTLTTFDGGFAYEGETVLEENAGEESLSFLFFRDGVREITFATGVSREETDRFLDVLASAFAAGSVSVDMANELWEAGLPHIKHRTVDRIVEGAYIEAADSPTLENIHRRFVDASGTGGGETADGEPGGGGDGEEEVDEGPYQGVQRQRFQHIVQVFGDVTALTAEEKSRVAILARELRESAPEKLGLDVLLEILRAAEDTRVAEETVAVLERQVERCVENARWDLVHEIIDALRTLEPETDSHLQRRIREAISRICRRDHFERLASFLNANPQTDLEAIRALLPLYGSPAIMPITAMLGTLEGRPARMMVCEFLSKQGRDTIDLVGGFIYDKRWFVVRNVAMILGEIGHERALTFLRRSASHADARVRLETLRAAAKIGGSNANVLVREFLKDGEVDLRKRALRVLGQTGDPAVRDEIRALVADDDSMPDKDPQELREMFVAHVRLGGERAVSDLVDVIGKNRLFGRSRWQAVRVAATHSLADATVSRAREKLEELSHDRNEAVAAAARAALQHLRAPQAHPGTHDDVLEDFEE